VEGRRQQTTAGANLHPERITITFPIHPLLGAKLVLLGVGRWIGRGRRFADVEHPAGGRLRVPLDWTDRGRPWTSPHVNGRPVRLAVGGLLEIAGALDVALGRALAGNAARAEGLDEEPAGAGADGAKNARGELGEPAGRGSTRRPSRVGVARAEDAPGSNDRRGGCR